MPRVKNVFRCQSCGASTLQWAGQCTECGGWNTLVEEREPARPGAVRAVGFSGQAAAIRSLADVEDEAVNRLTIGLSEFDRVLGGGLVAGSVVLLGGDPGIGKSTLLLQVAAALGATAPVLYVTGEESLSQVSTRATRLGFARAPVRLVAETCAERILALTARAKPRVLMIDSIQTMFSETLQSAPGAVAQLRETAAQLTRFAKQTGTAVFLVGHVTKEGVIAGPRVLEHMVDTVLYFESDAGSRFRAIRAVKNRFGAANELGVFAMTETGLRQVKNPSAIFLSRHEAPVSGSVVTVTREGSRPLLVEVQALVDESQLANPRRVAAGLDANRLSLLLAVLHRHGGIAMAGQDVFVNVVGGLRIAETAADLPMLLAAFSSLRDRPLDAGLVVFGEVGLAGEIRPVPNGEERLREAAKHGFKRALVPAANKPRQGAIDGMDITPVARLQDALDAVA
jgi:DNA repair protein RadA/Sms